jgi:methionyl aminopeptidase
MFAYLRPFVVPGVTTLELDVKAQTFILDNGGVPAFLGYPSSGDHMDFRQPSVLRSTKKSFTAFLARVLRPGDIIGLDCGINLDGFYSDAAITIALPPVAPETEKLLTVTRECLDGPLLLSSPVDGSMIFPGLSIPMPRPMALVLYGSIAGMV